MYVSESRAARSVAKPQKKAFVASMLSFVLVCTFVCLMFPAYGMKESFIGPIEPIFLSHSRDWPDGIEDLLLSPDRVYSVDVNGNETFYFNGGVDTINALVAEFAEVDLPVRSVTFRVGEPVTERTEYGAFRYTARLHLPSGMYLGYAKEMQNEILFPTLASLTVYVDTMLVEQLDQIRIPEGIMVRGVTDDIGLVIQALGSSNARVRSAAARKLDGLGVAAMRAKNALLKAKHDEDDNVRRAVGRALRNIDADTEDPVPARSVRDFVRRHQSKEFINLSRKVKMGIVLIPAGEFMMGGREKDELPQHSVQIAEPFYIGECEVTQAQWKAVMGTRPAAVRGNNLPVEGVSWHDCKEFCRRLSEKTRRTGRLPSEAEWEYACRAGSTTAYFFGDDVIRLFKYGWPYRIPTRDGKYRLRQVGGKLPNAWGLHDTIGNVMEWCEDVWHENYKGAPADGSAWTTGGDEQRRVLRSATWNGPFFSLNRSAFRACQKADHQSADNLPVGFRVVVEAEKK